jgi:TM2 domain-containing membrane protein YozV
MKDKNIAAILALFLGAIGVHKFYLGRIGAGVLYLIFSFTFIPAVLGLIDFFVLALMDQDEFNRRYNGADRLPPSPVVVNMLPPPGYPPPGYGYYPPPPYPHGAAPQPVPHAPRTADELAAALEKLNELRIAGLLTDEEFQAQKQKLLASM